MFLFELLLLSLIIQMNLSEQIIRIRKSKGINQKDFAKKLGISQSHYNAIENGRKNITIELLEKTATITKMQLIITLIDK